MCACLHTSIPSPAEASAINTPIRWFLTPQYDNGERFDLRLPYVDEGYVDESASLGNTIKRLFGLGALSVRIAIATDLMRHEA